MKGKNVGFGTGRAMMDRGLSKVHGRIALIAVVTALFGAACVNPFSGSDTRSPAPSEGSGRLFVTLDNGITAQTILPDDKLADVIATYDVLLTDPPEGADGVISHTALDPGTAFPFELSEIKAGTWTLTVHGRNESDEIVASYSQSVTITDGGTTAVEVALRGTQDGTGRLVYTLTWAAGEADAVEVELRSGSYTAPGTILESSTYTFIPDDGANPPRGQLVVTLEEINSGDHLLIVRLKRESGTNAPVSEAVQIYDHRTSSKTVNLPAGALTQPPAAPENLVVEFIGENLFNIYWTDASTTEEGFRVFGYDLNDPNGAQQLGDDLSAGSTALMNLSAPFTSQELPIDEYTLEVVSFNQFGESDPLALTLRLFPESQLPDFNPLSSSSSNDSSWIALDNPGRLESGTPVIGGADSMDLFVSGTDDLHDPFAFPAPTHTGGTLSYDLAELTERSPGATFWWRTQAYVGTARIVYPVRQFTFRDGVIYVNPTGTSGAAGSASDPLNSIQDAENLAEPGETVFIGAGTYDERITIGTPDLTLEGVGDDSLITSTDTTGTTILIGSSATGVTIRDLQIQPTEASTRTALNISGIDATIENNLFSENPSAADGTTYRGISGGRDGTLITGNRFVLADTTVTLSTRFAINMTGSATDPEAPIRIEGNKFQFGDGPGNSNIGIQPQGNNQLVANNIIVQGGNSSGPAFTGLRISGTHAGVVFLHNSVINTNSARTYWGISVEGGENSIITNNLFQGLPGANDTGIRNISGTIVEANMNLFWNFNSVAGALGTTAEDLNTQEFAAGNVVGDPMLFSGGGIDSDDWFAPSAMSLIPDGDSSYLNTVTKDILGTLRERPAIGAYEIPLSDVIVARWPFDEGNETLDVSQYSNTLGQTGDQVEPSYSEDNQDGNFFAVLGQSTHGYTAPASMFLSSGRRGQTYSFWYRSTSANGDDFGQQGTIIRRDRLEGDTPEERMVIEIGSTNAINTLGIAVNNLGQNNVDVKFGEELSATVWNHIVVVFDYENERIRIYVDGQQVRDVTLFTDDGRMQDDGPVYIGRYPEPQNVAQYRSVLGHLDDVRIYNHPLSTEAVGTLHNEGR